MFFCAHSSVSFIALVATKEKWVPRHPLLFWSDKGDEADGGMGTKEHRSDAGWRGSGLFGGDWWAASSRCAVVRGSSGRSESCVVCSGLWGYGECSGFSRLHGWPIQPGGEFSWVGAANPGELTS